MNDCVLVVVLLHLAGLFLIWHCGLGVESYFLIKLFSIFDEPQQHREYTDKAQRRRKKDERHG
jgi:hypothetical protein